MARKQDPSDLTEGQWRFIQRFVPKPARRGRKPIDQQEIISAIHELRHCVLRTACPWQALPHDFPHGQTVFNIFRQWVIHGGRQAGHDGLRELVRKALGLRGFLILPKRWIVERTFAWLGRRRRLRKDYKRNPATSEAMIPISMMALMSRRLTAAKNNFRTYS